MDVLPSHAYSRIRGNSLRGNSLLGNSLRESLPTPIKKHTEVKDMLRGSVITIPTMPTTKPANLKYKVWLRGPDKEIESVMDSKFSQVTCSSNMLRESFLPPIGKHTKVKDTLRDNSLCSDLRGESVTIPSLPTEKPAKVKNMDSPCPDTEIESEMDSKPSQVSFISDILCPDMAKEILTGDSACPEMAKTSLTKQGVGVSTLKEKDVKGPTTKFIGKSVEVEKRQHMEDIAMDMEKVSTKLQTIPDNFKKMVQEVTGSVHPNKAQVDRLTIGPEEISCVEDTPTPVSSTKEGMHSTGGEFQTQPKHPEYLFLYCSLFPLNYEFGKEELVQLWIAEGFICDTHQERMEDIGCRHFDSLVSKKLIEPSRYDYSLGFDSYMSNEKVLVPPVFDSNGGIGMLYKVNEAKASYLKVASSEFGYLSLLDGKLDDPSELTLHLSLPCESINDQMGLEILKKYKYLHTLHLLSGCGNSIKRVPRDLFLSLKLLRTLNLSRTLISELPSSIGNVKSLRYLDVSHTRIRHLPESIDCLSNLQTLKLRGCLDFLALPKNMMKLTNLRHLQLDTVPRLISMPKRIGNLTSLQTLSAFLVGTDDECGIEELKNMNDLSGAFCISRLERVSSLDKAKEAALIEKKYLSKLELRWSDTRVVKPEEEEEILECLRPHSGLREIQILFYGGLKLPSWISDPSFADLVAITLYKCRNCKLLPSIGELPLLEFLCIKEMNEVKEIDHQFCRNGKDKRNQGFAKLENLTIDVMLNLEEWMGVENGDLPALHKLTLECCPKLIALPSLWCLDSLEHLEIKHCPKLLCLPNEALPTSLEFLLIKDCPELKERCCKGEGQDWGKIEHVPNIWIDNQEISSS